MPDSADAASVSLRRLTRVQLHHTLRDLLGDALPPSLDVRELLPLDDEHGGFASNSTVPPTELTQQQIERAVDAVIEAVRPRRAQLASCLGSSDPDSACLEAWIDVLAPRAFRRPLRPDEFAALYALVQLAPSDPPVDVGMDRVDAAIERGLRALLLSPDFLYRVEQGEPTGSDTVLRLSDYEIAARLSYLVWSSMPDAELWARAAEGALQEPAVRVEQLERMLGDDRARQGLADMHIQWLELVAVDSLSKDLILFPTWNDGLRPLMRQQFELFVDYVIRHDDGRLGTLLTSTVEFVTPALSPWYGAEAQPIEAPAGLVLPEGFSAVSLDPSRRAGVLTRLAPLVVHAHAGRGDPVARGAVVSRRLLCQVVPPAPPDVPMGAAEPAPGTSQRDILEQHSADPTCAACHAQIDPIGLLLSNYDAMGRFADEDLEGNPIDARGSLPGSEVDEALEGPVQMSEALARSAAVQRCYAEQWLSYALGRPLTAQDASWADPVTDAFSAADGHIPTLLRALVAADAFVHRRVP